MARGRKPSLHMVLSLTERSILERWQRSTTMAAGLVRRGRIILLLANGLSHSHMGHMVGVQRSLVRQWARRLLAQRLAGRAAAPGRRANGFFPPRGGDPVVRLAGERPETLGRSLSQWDCRELARQRIAEGIVADISRRDRAADLALP